MKNSRMVQKVHIFVYYLVIWGCFAIFYMKTSQLSETDKYKSLLSHKQAIRGSTPRTVTRLSTKLKRKELNFQSSGNVVCEDSVPFSTRILTLLLFLNLLPFGSRFFCCKEKRRIFLGFPFKLIQKVYL